MESVDLDNGDDDLGEPGDSVGVATRWQPPSLFDGVTREHAAEVQSALREAQTTGEPYKLAAQAGARWIGALVAEVIGLDLADDHAKARAKTIVKTWLETGVIREDFLTVDREKRPILTAGRPSGYWFKKSH